MMITLLCSVFSVVFINESIQFPFRRHQRESAKARLLKVDDRRPRLLWRILPSIFTVISTIVVFTQTKYPQWRDFQSIPLQRDFSLNVSYISTACFCNSVLPDSCYSCVVCACCWLFCVHFCFAIMFTSQPAWNMYNQQSSVLCLNCKPR